MSLNESAPAARPQNRFSTFPALVAIALIGSVTWAFGLWVGPKLVPGPKVPERAFIDHEAEIDPLRTVLALSVSDGVSERRPLPAIDRTVKLGRGDTLMELLLRARIDRSDAYYAIEAMRKLHNPRDLMPGTPITLTYQALADIPDPPLSFRGFSFKPSIEKTVTVARSWDNQFEGSLAKTPLIHSQAKAKGEIDSSIYVDAVKAGVPVNVVVELIRAFSFEVDFQREIHPGDGYEVFYDRLTTPDGQLARTGNVIYGALILKGKRYALYHHRMRDGTTDYFNGKGESVRKALMRTPIDGARLSSRFGRRRHPILGYNKMHKGIDFAAPQGTRIMAAGNGVVVHAGRNGGYGLYVRIRHNTTYSTAYAHMRGIAKGVRRGQRVRQGQTIGYVGTTGRSTGPHLHYEVLRNNRQVNPLGLKLPTGETLKGAELKRFLAAKSEIDGAFANLTD
jgi:murein DD-endopeptidase MepM/ murein hydrolase activator NlpD